MEIIKFLSIDFLMLILSTGAVLAALIHVARIALVTRLHIRRVDKVISFSQHALLRSDIFVDMLDRIDDALPPDKRLQINETVRQSVQLEEALLEFMRGMGVLKPGRAASAETMAVIETMEAEVVQPQIYHAVQMRTGAWAVAYINEKGEEAIACAVDDQMEARRQALARNIAGEADTPTAQISHLNGNQTDDNNT